MAESDPDPWRARLSEVLDGELSAGEQAEFEVHVARCASCARLLRELRALVRAARALPTTAPERDLWPGLRATLEPNMPSRSLTRWLAFAAGVLLTSAVFLMVGRSRPDSIEVAALTGESYLLLLHEPPEFNSGQDEAQHAALVQRYSRWAQDLGARCLGGEELEARGLELRPRGGEVLASELAPGEHVGGYFLLQTRDRAEARALAETCPHLGQGGWIELRRIQATPTGNHGEK